MLGNASFVQGSSPTLAAMKTINRHRTSGFTLFELVVVIGISAILAAVGVSSFKYVTSANRISTEINGLLGDLQFARSEAQKQGQYVTICPANTTGTGCVATNDWSSGWIVFVDLNNNQQFDSATEGAILRRQNALSDNLLGSATTLQYVTFNREGFANTGITTTWGTLTLNSIPSNPNYRRCVAISMVGAIRTETSGATIPTSC
jgi:type IV fimbrial biogenesis protein FimT